MRFGSRDLTGLRAQSANYRLHPASFWLPSPSDEITATSTRPSATITGSASTHTKGNWGQVIAATTSDATMLEIFVGAPTFTNAANTSALLDIGIGAAASETVIIADIPVGYIAGSQTLFRIPVFVPAGSRIAARVQAATASKAIVLGVIPYRMESNLRAAPSCTTYGPVSGSSIGTVPTAPGSLNTKGAWTEVTAATTERLGALAVLLQGGASTTMAAGGAAAGVLVDVGMGGSGSEVLILRDVYANFGGSENITQFNAGAHPVDVPAGARLAVRYARASTTNTPDVTLIGAPVRGG